MANKKKTVWMHDANHFDFDEDTINLIHRTKTVRDFLEYDAGTIIAGTKGWGKTFLLKAKRMLDKNRAICLPFKKHVDKIAVGFYDLNYSTIEYLLDLKNSIKIWEISIFTSIYKYIKDYNKDDSNQLFEIGDLNYKKQIDSFMGRINGFTGACDIFCYLIKENRGEIEKIRNAFEATLLNKFSYINKPISYYIDSVDEAFRYYLDVSEQKSIWYNIQQGLINAVYNLNTLNPRIKIYIAARKEVLAKDIGGELSQQIRSTIVNLSYTMYDMKEMFQKYVLQENDENLVHPSKKITDAQLAFFGINTVSYDELEDTEDVFDYIYRHTFGRPRDFIQICKSISNLELSQRSKIEIIKDIVNQQGHLISKDYFMTVKSFTDNFDENDLESLFGLIKKNVLSKNEVINVCFEFNNRTCNKICQNINEAGKKNLSSICRDENGYKIKHPFCSLYNIGFIGIIKEKKSNDKIQSFRLPGDSIESNILSLPDSERYILHPALNHWIQEVQRSKGVIVKNMYSVTRERIIGYNKPWKDSNRLSWLHLSNIHFKMTNCPPEQIQKLAIDYLNMKIKELGDKKFDFAVVTGDLDYKNSGNNDLALGFLKNLILEHLENKENIFIVPGNHDLYRDETRLKVISDINNESNYNKLISDSEILAHLNNSFTMSQRNCAFIHTYKTIKDCDYPLESQHFVEKREKFNIIHLNTCIFSGYEKEEGTLLFDSNKLEEILEKEDIKESGKLNIAIGHHNIEAFNQNVQKEVYDIFNKFNIQMYLCGHDKNPYAAFNKNEIDQTCILTCAAGNKGEHSAVGMITGSIDTEQYNGSVMFHKWSTFTENWVIDNEARRDAINGILPISLKK